jgi:hypothetical protein
MIQQDKKEKERSEAKNSVEEYIYEIREKLSNEYERFILEEVKFLKFFLEFFSASFLKFKTNFKLQRIKMLFSDLLTIPNLGCIVMKRPIKRKMFTLIVYSI